MPEEAEPPIATRLVQVKVPEYAKEGDLLLVQTELGLFEVPISEKLKTLRPGKQVNTDIPVPEEWAADKKLEVQGVKLSRDGKEVEKPPELIKLRVAVPGNAKKNDLLTIHTQLGQFDLNVPAAHNKTIEVEIPVEPAEAARLNGKTLTVSKLLLNGVDIAKPSPLKRKNSFESNKPTRRVAFPLPKDASPGDTLDVQTELGVYQITVPPKAGKVLEANLPVPSNCDLPSLTVAWVRKAASAAAPSAAPAPAPPPAAADAPVFDGSAESEPTLTPPKNGNGSSSASPAKSPVPIEKASAAINGAQAEVGSANAAIEAALQRGKSQNGMPSSPTSASLLWSPPPSKAQNPCEALCQCFKGGP